MSRCIRIKEAHHPPQQGFQTLKLESCQSTQSILAISSSNGNRDRQAGLLGSMQDGSQQRRTRMTQRVCDSQRLRAKDPERVDMKVGLEVKIFQDAPEKKLLATNPLPAGVLSPRGKCGNVRSCMDDY